MASSTGLSPGPGVVITLTNVLRYQMCGTLGGNLGIALVALVVAAVSTTGLGVMLAKSAFGVAYLAYLRFYVVHEDSIFVTLYQFAFKLSLIVV